MKVKSFLTLDLEISQDGVLDKIHEEVIGTICIDCELELVDNLHITLDNIGLKNIEDALDRLEKLALKGTELKYTDDINIGKINSFISHTNGKRIFFLEIEGGFKYFECLKNNGCNLNIPHVTLLEMDNILDDERVEKILINLNNNIILRSYISQIFVNKSIIFLKYRTQNRTLKIIGSLRIT